MLKTSGFALSFQHLHCDLANVNEQKIMFDPIYGEIEKKFKLHLRNMVIVFSILLP